MYQTSKFVGAVRYNMPKSCATLLCRALRRVTRMCSSTLSDPANRLQNKRCGNPTAVPLFSSGRRSLVCARLSNKGKVGVQRGRKTAGCPSFLPTAVGTASSPRRARQPPALRRAQLPAEVQRKTLRPLGANMPAAVRVPRSAGAGKRAAPSGRTRQRQFECPAQSVQRKEPPRQGEHAYAVRAPRWVGAEKISRKFLKS